MDFLLKLGIDNIVIDKIKYNNLPNVIRQFICDKDNVIENIKYLNKIGIQVVDDLLIRRTEIFIIDPEKIKKSFEGYNIPVLVALINEDISAINFL